LGKRSLRSRKGLSTAVGTAFYIIVVMISLSSMWAIGAFQARYQAVTDKMNVWDTERISENLNVRSVNNTIRQIGQLKYNFSMTVDNNGGVAVNIARIYFLDQTKNKLNISDPINGSAPKPRLGFNYSVINVGEVSHVIAVNVTTQLSLALKASHPCRIILATDRGRQFSYAYPPSSQGEGGIGYAIIISDGTDNFQYQDKINAYHVWTSAWFKSKTIANNHPLYRIALQNATPKRLQLHSVSYMHDQSTGQDTIRYIVSNTTDVDNSNPIPFSSQTINPLSTSYVYFARDNDTGNWVGDGDTGYAQVGFLLAFNYEGESEARVITLPVQAHRIKS